VTEEKWYPTTPRRSRDPVKVVLLVMAGFGCCGLLWALVLVAIFVSNPDRPSGSFVTTTSAPITPARPAADGPPMSLNTTGISPMTRTPTPAPAPLATPRLASTPQALTRLGATAAALMLSAACAAPGHGSHAVPTAASMTSSVPPSVPFGGAPAVSNPLPATVLDGDPCTEALTPDQVETAIGVRVPGEREDLPQIGPACAWTNHATSGAVSVSYDLNTHTGLSSVYANTQPKSAIWRPLPPVQGFPAVAAAGVIGNQPPLDFCQASIGLADTYTVDISLHLGDSKRGHVDPCGPPLRRICDLVITTLRAQGRP
jgi:hypothetical protein